jgi:hypothetical protein
VLHFLLILGSGFQRWGLELVFAMSIRLSFYQRLWTSLHAAGRFCLPIPRRPKHGITLVVGVPVHYKSVPKGGQVSQEEVDAVAALYFQQLSDLFESYKADAGYPQHKLKLVTTTVEGSFTQRKKEH